MKRSSATRQVGIKWTENNKVLCAICRWYLPDDRRII